jgi:hypothetical protein
MKEGYTAVVERVMAKPKALGEKPVPLPLLITTNSAQIDLESKNPGLCGKTASLHAHNTDLQKLVAFRKWMSNAAG